MRRKLLLSKKNMVAQLRLVRLYLNKPQDFWDYFWQRRCLVMLHVYGEIEYISMNTSYQLSCMVVGGVIFLGLFAATGNEHLEVTELILNFSEYQSILESNVNKVGPCNRTTAKERMKVLQCPSQSPNLNSRFVKKCGDTKDWWSHTESDYFKLLLWKLVLQGMSSWGVVIKYVACS